MTLEEWLALRKEAGLQIDPETAEVTWDWGPIGDPYEIYPPDPEENSTVLGRGDKADRRPPAPL
jgi:hypothetical protein